MQSIFYFHQGCWYKVSPEELLDFCKTSAVPSLIFVALWLGILMLALHLMRSLERYMIWLSSIVLCLCLCCYYVLLVALAIMDFYVDCGSWYLTKENSEKPVSFCWPSNRKIDCHSLSLKVHSNSYFTKYTTNWNFLRICNRTSNVQVELCSSIPI